MPLDDHISNNDIMVHYSTIHGKECVRNHIFSFMLFYLTL